MLAWRDIKSFGDGGFDKWQEPTFGAKEELRETLDEIYPPAEGLQGDTFIGNSYLTGGADVLCRSMIS